MLFTHLELPVSVVLKSFNDGDGNSNSNGSGNRESTVVRVSITIRPIATSIVIDCCYTSNNGNGNGDGDWDGAGIGNDDGNGSGHGYCAWSIDKAYSQLERSAAASPVAEQQGARQTRAEMQTRRTLVSYSKVCHIIVVWYDYAVIGYMLL